MKKVIRSKKRIEIKYFELREITERIAKSLVDFMNPPPGTEMTERVRNLNEAYIAYIKWCEQNPN